MTKIVLAFIIGVGFGYTWHYQAVKKYSASEEIVYNVDAFNSRMDRLYQNLPKED